MLDRLWICADGRRMLAGQMTDSHLQNCINKIKRSRHWRKSWLPRLLLEQQIRRLRP